MAKFEGRGGAVSAKGEILVQHHTGTQRERERERNQFARLNKKRRIGNLNCVIASSASNMFPSLYASEIELKANVLVIRGSVDVVYRQREREREK